MNRKHLKCSNRRFRILGLKHTFTRKTQCASQRDFLCHIDNFALDFDCLEMCCSLTISGFLNYTHVLCRNIICQSGENRFMCKIPLSFNSLILSRTFLITSERDTSYTKTTCRTCAPQTGPERFRLF